MLNNSNNAARKEQIATITISFTIHQIILTFIIIKVTKILRHVYTNSKIKTIIKTLITLSLFNLHRKNRKYNKFKNKS